MVERKAFGHWLSGLVDGEGTFHIAVTKRKGTRWRYKVSCRFVIGLRDDDAPVLRTIREYLGVGRYQRVLQAGSKPELRLVLESLSDHLGVTIPHFDQFPLRAKKSRDYVFFRQAVMVMKEVNERPRAVRPGDLWWSKWQYSDIDRVLRIKEQMQLARRYVPS